MNRGAVLSGRLLAVGALAVAAAAPALAGFGSTETYLPAVGRVPGKNGAQFYTTVWATNLTAAPQTFTFQFLKTGQTNPAPASFHDTLQPGETKVYENVVESKLGLSDALGAARILSSGEIFVSERIYDQSPGDELGNTEGLFFAGVPKGFSISAGQSATIQGIDQGGSENFRYNFALIETGGGSPTVNVQVLDGSGTMLGQKAYPLLPYEHVQPSVDDVVPGIATTNARITATVTGGSGSVLLAGAQVANESQDSSGFEMTFRDSLLGGSSSGGGLSAVAHDGTLRGNGTSGSPLGINPGSVVASLNGLHGAVTLTAGSNVTITPSGSTLTIASSSGGGGGGLTLPYSGSTSSSNPAFTVTNSGSGSGIAGTTSGSGGSTAGVSGTCPTNVLCTGVLGTGQTGLAAHGTATGVYAETSAANSVALYAINDASSGYIAHFENGPGVDRVTINTSGNLVANSASGDAITGNSASGTGVSGSGNFGVLGYSPTGRGAYGDSDSGYGVYGLSNSGDGVYAFSNLKYGLHASTSNSVGSLAIYCEGSGQYTGTWTLSSDARFKEKIEPLQSALERTLSLRGVTFDWRRDEFPERHFRNVRDIGFIAQEVESVYPELVVTDHDGYKSVDYARVTPILVEAIKAQQRQIDALFRRIEQLEASRRDPPGRTTSGE